MRTIFILCEDNDYFFFILDNKNCSRIKGSLERELRLLMGPDLTSVCCRLALGC